MYTPEIILNWNERKNKLRQKFSFLTENDLALDDNKKEEMIVKLQHKLGKTKAELLKIIEAL